MISPVPRVPAAAELLGLYAQLAAADPLPLDAPSEGDNPLREVAQVRRALELLEDFRRAVHGEPEPVVDGLLVDSSEARRIGPFEIYHEVGRGGWGIVFRAKDRRFDREVALKLPLLEYAGHPQFGRRFVREAKLLESLDHPNLVKVFEAGGVPTWDSNVIKQSPPRATCSCRRCGNNCGGKKPELTVCQVRTAAAALVRSWGLGPSAARLILNAAAAEVKYTQKRNALARRCHTRTTRKKLAALGIRLTGLPRCGWSKT